MYVSLIFLIYGVVAVSGRQCHLIIISLFFGFFSDTGLNPSIHLIVILICPRANTKSFPLFLADYENVDDLDLDAIAKIVNELGMWIIMTHLRYSISLLARQVNPKCSLQHVFLCDI